MPLDFPAQAPAAPGARAVPWHLVGSGWSAVVWHTPVHTQADASAPGTLLLVGRGGERYPITAVPFWTSLEDVSPDGRRVVFVTNGHTAWMGTPRVTVLDLRTRRTTTFLLKGEASQVRFTRPSGDSLLIARAATAFVVERRSLSGRLLRSYGQAPFPAASVLLPTRNGTYLLVRHARGIAVRSLATGRMIRLLKAPAGQTCQPQRWWNATTATVICTDAADVYRVWLYPLSGARPIRLTAGAIAGAAQGFDDGWRAGRGALVQSMSMIMTPELFRRDARGRITPVRWPSTVVPAGPRIRVHAVVAGWVYLGVATGGEGFGIDAERARSLIRIDPITGRARTLAGPGANGGAVTAVAVIDPLA
jgi:hypothetical protein